LPIFLGTSIKELRQHPNLLLFKNSQEAVHREFYDSLKEPVKDKFTITHLMDGQSPFPLDSKRKYSVLEVAVKTVSPDKIIKEKYAFNIFSQTVYSALISSFELIQSKEVIGFDTVMTSFSEEEPYLWPLDVWLLELIYKDQYDYSSAPREQVVEYILDQMEFDQYR